MIEIDPRRCKLCISSLIPGPPLTTQHLLLCDGFSRRNNRNPEAGTDRCAAGKREKVPKPSSGEAPERRRANPAVDRAMQGSAVGDVTPGSSALARPPATAPPGPRIGATYRLRSPCMPDGL